MTAIYRLISIDKECFESQYVNAISYSKEILQNMIKHIHPDLLFVADFIIKPNTDIYKLVSFNGKILMRKYDSDNISFNPDNLYAFNKITAFNIENILLDITGFDIKYLRNLHIFETELSENTINFDVFYQEGIMNA